MIVYKSGVYGHYDARVSSWKVYFTLFPLFLRDDVHALPHLQIMMGIVTQLWLAEVLHLPSPTLLPVFVLLVSFASSPLPAHLNPWLRIWCVRHCLHVCVCYLLYLDCLYSKVFGCLA